MSKYNYVDNLTPDTDLPIFTSRGNRYNRGLLTDQTWRESLYIAVVSVDYHLLFSDSRHHCDVHMCADLFLTNSIANTCANSTYRFQNMAEPEGSEGDQNAV